MKEIKARDGFYLTQSSDVVEERLFLTAIKGENIIEGDWREATEAEKNAFEKALKEKWNAENNDEGK